MNLSFSTNGWSGFGWEDFYSMAKDLGFKGVEIHDIGRSVYYGAGGPLRPENIGKTVRTLASLELSIPCIDALCDIADAQRVQENIEEIKRHIDLASKLNCPYVRVHAGNGGENTDEIAQKVLRACLEDAENKKVAMLVETVGAYSDTAKLRDLLNIFACDNIAALWDMSHPYRDFGESPEQTITNLGAYIKHVHIKDSVSVDGKTSYRLMGEGDMPIDKMMFALTSINYEGFVSFEWIPTWIEEIGDAGIVFPHFINYMSRFDAQSNKETQLYDNKTKTGKFIWKKEALINMTCSQVLDKVCEHFPDQYAFRYTTLDYTRTYTQFRDDVDEFARVLISLGVKSGDKVAIWATNVPQWFVTFWATTKIGAVLVTVNTAYKIHEAEYLFRQSDTHTLVMIEGSKDASYVDIVNELCPELAENTPGEPLHCRRLPFLRNVITVGCQTKGALTWEQSLQFASKTPIEEVRRRASMVDPHDVGNMQYTSGTTGFPKGVMLTHYNFLNNGKCIGDRMDLSTADRMMIQVPMFHCFGMVLSMTAAMTHGVTMSPIPYFSPKNSLACINNERITCFHGVPTMFIALLEHDDFAKTDFSHMRTGIMAGSPCPIAVMQDVVDKMHMPEITIVYGQTEASPGCTMSSADDPLEVRVSTVGGPLPKIECKIVDPETGEEVPDGVNGEFVARGYNIMKGYYKMPQATDAAIDAEGWLHTGDLACRTPEGNFRITGRLKDMIIRGGENIYPKEIEEFIYTHPKVSDVQVIGVPDEQYGEEIMACVILKENEEMTVEELKQYVLDHMARHKVPRYIDFVDSFPMNAAGKILKYKMREDAVKKYNLSKAAGIETA
ncbi:MAG: AMP-dependent synthetase [Ruminococcaceae bacterium]|nr:AMP-dependent synthetase [Oscillospiraceae bacterium]